MAAALAVLKKSMSQCTDFRERVRRGSVVRCTGVSTMARTLGNTKANSLQEKSKYNGQNNSKYNGRYSGQHNGTGVNTIASTLANTMAKTRANTMARTRASTEHARPSSHVETLAVFGRPAPHRWSSATDFPCLRQLPPPPFKKR